MFVCVFAMLSATEIAITIKVSAPALYPPQFFEAKYIWYSQLWSNGQMSKVETPQDIRGLW